MARIIRHGNLVATVTAADTHTFGTSTGQYTTLAGLTPPILGARPVAWWIYKTTVGTGTGTMECFLVAAGGTSSTRAVTSTIILDPDAAAPTYQESQFNPTASALYELTSADIGKNLDINWTTGSTTLTNAPAGISVGVIWQM